MSFSEFADSISGMDILNSLYLTDILRIISNALLAPVVIVLLLLMAYALWSIGSVVAEVFTERLNFRAKMPMFLADLAAPGADIPQVIAKARLLKRQKVSLLTLWDFRLLPESTYVALAKRLIATEDLRYRRIVDRQSGASKIAPMFGLMGTLIPLGPGIVALGQGQTDVLAASIGTAFYTTVAGLISAAVFFVISRIRGNWYEEYMTSLETAATAVLEVVDKMRAADELGLDGEPGTSLYDLGFKRLPAKYRAIAETVAAESVEKVPVAEPDAAEEAVEAAAVEQDTVAKEADVAVEQGTVTDGELSLDWPEDSETPEAVEPQVQPEQLAETDAEAEAETAVDADVETEIEADADAGAADDETTESAAASSTDDGADLVEPETEPVADSNEEAAQDGESEGE